MKSFQPPSFINIKVYPHEFSTEPKKGETLQSKIM